MAFFNGGNILTDTIQESTVDAGVSIEGNLIASGIQLANRTVSTNDSIISDDYTIFANASGGNITLTLPDASTVDGKIFIIKKIDSSTNTVTIDTGGENIDNNSTLVISNENDAKKLQSDNTNWYVLSTNSATNVSTQSYFSVYENTGDIDITAGWTDLTWDTEIRKDSDYTFTTGTSNVTIGSTGDYIIHTDITTYVQTGGNRRQSQAKLQLNTGVGFADIPGTNAFMYNRTLEAGWGTCTIRIIQSLSSGDIIKVQAQKLVGNGDVYTYTQGCRLNIERIS